MNTRQRVIHAFQQRFDAAPAALATAPGRVNLLGEHVDYNDGFVLPAAIDRLTYVAFSPAESAISCLLALDFGQETCFSSELLAEKRTAGGAPLPGWALYPAGVAWAIEAAGLPAPAMNAVFVSDVPIGAGLSSSASVEMAFAKAWSHLGGWSLSGIDFAKLGLAAENRYVGVRSGIMDPFAAACGLRQQLLLLDCRSLEWRALPLPPQTDLVIADSSIRRSLADSAYNERRRSCESALAKLQTVLPGAASWRDVSPEQFDRHCQLLTAAEQKRARHVVEEIERTRQAIPLLERGQAREFGQLMTACHASLRDLYEVSLPQLDFLVESALHLPGCLGARLTGAGFGGCTVNLVEKTASRAFVAALAVRYQLQTGLRLNAFICQAENGHSVQALP